ncbi:MAG TPA: SurA N-terminal domain-containing protein [Bdellovibrionota bacterium]|nr:SurA N-terminal domain-containing protein [Bdellovibrionota bacterium]
MLKTMRSSVSSWTIKALMVALILSFVSFYGWQAGQGCNPANTAAVVDGTAITSRDLESRTKNLVNAYERMGLLKGNVTPDMLLALRGNVLSAMIDEHVKSTAAQKLGLVASAEGVREAIEKQFSGEGGSFDFELYKKVLAYRLGKTPAEYEEEQARALVVQDFDRIFENTASVTDYELRLEYASKNEKVNLAAVEIDSKTLGAKAAQIETPSEDESKAYFEGHRSSYQEPENRMLEILWIGVSESVSSPKAEDDQINKAKTTLEKLKEKGESQKSFQGLASDPTVHYIKTEWLPAGGTIPGIPDGAQLLRATAALSEGAIHGPVRGFLSPNTYLIRVAGFRASVAPEFQTVRGRVQDDLLREKKSELAKKYATELLAKWRAAKKPIDLLAKSEKLTVSETGEFTRASSNRIPKVGTSATAMMEAFTRTPADPFISEPVPSGEKIYILALKNHVAPDWAKFEETKPELQKNALGEAGRARERSWTSALREKTKIQRLSDAPAPPS